MARVRELREVLAGDLTEVGIDLGREITLVGTEPGGVSGGGARDTKHVRGGVPSKGLGTTNGRDYLRLLVGRAVLERRPFVVGAGGREVTGELDLSGIPNSGGDVLEGSIVVDNGEEVRWLDGVLSSAGLGEVVCSGHWRSFHEMTPGSKVIEMIHLRS